MVADNEFGHPRTGDGSGDYRRGAADGRIVRWQHIVMKYKLLGRAMSRGL